MARPVEVRAMRQVLDGCAAMDRATFEVVDAARHALAVGASETVEGMPLDLALANLARMTSADVHGLLAAADVLGDLPWLYGAWSRGEVSWSQVRPICRDLARRSRTDRGTIDRRLAATAVERGGVDGFAPDDLVAEVGNAIVDLDDPRSVRRREQRAARGGRVVFAPAFDGMGGTVIADEPDPARYAALTAAIDVAAGPPSPTTPRGRLRADGLHKLAAAWLGGGPDRPARPLLLVRVDIADVAVNTAGRILLDVRGVNLPTVSAATLDALATDADLRVVLFDGGTPLAVSDKTAAASVAARTRWGVLARDTGCRFPGSTDPAAHTDVHHDPPRNHGGNHHPDGLVSLARRRHTMRHRHGWQLSIDPATATVTATRRNRTLRSLPRGTPLTQARDHPDDPDPGARIWSGPDGRPLPF